MNVRSLVEESLFGTVLISLPMATSAWSEADFAPEALSAAVATFLVWTFVVWSCSALAGWKRARARRRRPLVPRLDF
jgi:hypothetical protein